MSYKRFHQWYNSTIRPWGGWRYWAKSRWLYYSRHLYHSVYISSSEGVDTPGSGSIDFPYKTLAYAAETIKDFRGRIRFRLKGKDIFYEEFPVLSDTPKYIWVEPYGTGRPAIVYKGDIGLTLHRSNTFCFNLNLVNQKKNYGQY